FDDEFFLRGVAPSDEEFGGGDEVSKRVALMAHPPGVVPGFAEFAPATNVRDGVHDTAIEKAQPVRAEVDGDGDAVAAVAIEQRWRRAIAWRVAAIDERYGDPRTVGGGGVNAFADVLRGIVAAENGLPFAENGLASREVVVVDRTGCDE